MPPWRNSAEVPFPEHLTGDETLISLTPYWLNVRCQCGRNSNLPFRLLSAQLGYERKVTDVAEKLRCSKADCGERPSFVAIVNDIAGLPNQPPPKTHVLRGHPDLFRKVGA